MFRLTVDHLCRLSRWRRRLPQFLGVRGTFDSPRAHSRSTFRALLEQLEPRTVMSASAITPSSILPPKWTPVGPAPVSYTTNVIPGLLSSSQDVGAVNALAVDPSNPEHVYAASVNGGIWQTSDYTAAQPIWTTTSDHLPSLAISAIAISPYNRNIIYAGTGNYSSAGGGDVFGPGTGDNAAGVYKSVDGGATWTVSNPGGIFDHLRIRRVVPTTLNGGRTVFAATTDTAVRDGVVIRGGVYRSNDGGQTWMRLSGTSKLPNTGVTDLIANPNNPKQFFAAVAGQTGGNSPGQDPNPVPAGDSGIYRLDLSASKPTWKRITHGAIGDTIANAVRVELSISKAGDHPIWVTTISQALCYSGVFRAPDSPTPTWTPIDPPDVLQNFEGDTKGCMLADPLNANRLYMAGDIINLGPYPTYVARYDCATGTWANITTNSPTFGAITAVQRAGGVATLMTPNYAFAVGQRVVVAGLADTSFNGTFKITAATATSFSYALAVPDVAETPDSGTATPADSPSLAEITTVERDGGVATVTANQSFLVGQTVVIAGLNDSSFNGTFTITGVSTTGTTFTYQSAGPHVGETPDHGIATLTAFGPGTVEPIQTGVLTAPHADTRSLQFGAGGQLLLADDGGIYACNDPEGTGTQVVWSSINGSMQDTEFYQVVLDNQGNTNPADDLILGAAQDNGASERTTSGTWVEHGGSDGVAVAADPASGTRYFSEAGYYLHTVTGAANQEASPPGTLTGTGATYVYLNPAASVPDGAVLAESLPFYTVFRLSQGDIAGGANPARMLLAGDRTLYLSGDQAQTYTSIGGIDGASPHPVDNCSYNVVTAMAFGCAKNPNAAYVAGFNHESDGAIIRGSVNISFTNDITAPGGGFTTTKFNLAAPGEVVWDIAIDPNDAQTAYVVTDKHVFMTTNGGQKWTSLTADLGPLVNQRLNNQYYFADVRSITLFNNGTPTKADDWVLVGEPGGVFRRMVEPTRFGYTWQRFGAGSTLPNTLFTSLVYDAKSDVLLAGTLGRGAWLLKNASAAITSTQLGADSVPATSSVSATSTATTLIVSSASTAVNQVSSNLSAGTSSVTIPTSTDLSVTATPLVASQADDLLTVPTLAVTVDDSSATVNVLLEEQIGSIAAN